MSRPARRSFWGAVAVLFFRLALVPMAYLWSVPAAAWQMTFAVGPAIRYEESSSGLGYEAVGPMVLRAGYAWSTYEFALEYDRVTRAEESGSVSIRTTQNDFLFWLRDDLYNYRKIFHWLGGAAIGGGWTDVQTRVGGSSRSQLAGPDGILALSTAAGLESSLGVGLQLEARVQFTSAVPGPIPSLAALLSYRF